MLCYGLQVYIYYIYVLYASCIGHCLHTEMKMGFESLNYVRVEGNETGVRVRVNGENVYTRLFLLLYSRYIVCNYMCI